MRGQHRRLPHLALLHFPVAKKREDVAILTGKFGRQREADRTGKPLPQ